MAANTGILTHNASFVNIASLYYTPTATLAATGVSLGKIYCFLSQVKPWPVDEVPPTPTQSDYDLKQVFKNMFFAKQITTNDMSPVIERIEWKTTTVYDYYQDNVNMFELDDNGFLVRKFYVKNRFDQVFKCLWNNNGGASTVEPIFEPGTFNANQIFQGADNYKWKYIYSISSGSKLKFMDGSWMPVPVGDNIPNPVSNFSGVGSIDVINVLDGGSGYDPANSIVYVTITGDGSYASADATITNGTITDIVMANTGSNYSFANVSISSAAGSGANVKAEVSPIGGHGYDPVTELGAKRIMLVTSFDKDEDGFLPTEIDFRQLGLLFNPYMKTSATSYAIANGNFYDVSTNFIVSAGFGAYIPDETVYQSPNGLLQDATYTATVLSFNNISNQLKLINTNGTANSSGLIYGATSGTARVVLQQTFPDFVKDSGYLIYLENRSPVQRNANGTEQFRLVLGY